MNVLPRGAEIVVVQYEVELKLPVPDLAHVRKRLRALGAMFDPPVDQADTYFAHPARDFARTDEALRLRQIGELNFITYKSPKLDAETKTRREIEIPLASGHAALEQFAELLLALGFNRILTVRKRREAGRLEWEGQWVELALDAVEGLGSFVELEIAADDSTLATSRTAVVMLAKRLRFGASERRSYLEMLIEGMS
jgi:adenylate cyclase class 2